MFGYELGTNFISFFFARLASDITAEYRRGNAYFDEGNDPEFNGKFAYTYDPDIQDWLVLDKEKVMTVLG